VDNLHLCSIIEGVEGTVLVRGAEVRVIVPLEALQRLCGAASEPGSWLGAAERHAEQLERLAVERGSVTGKTLVILGLH